MISKVSDMPFFVYECYKSVQEIWVKEEYKVFLSDKHSSSTDKDPLKLV